MGDDSFLEKVEDTISDIKNSSYLKVGVIAILAIIIGFLGVILLPKIAHLITAFFAIIGNFGVGISIWYLFDKYVLKSVDTIGEIKKGNIAYAILVLAIIILIAASIMAT